MPLKCRSSLSGNHRSSFALVRNSSDRQFSVAMAEVVALSLANICFDIQISICMLLHPSDILELRKVCGYQKFALHKSVKYHLLSRLVKLFNVAPGNV